MTIYLKLDNDYWPVGEMEFFKAFFSTIAANLEEEGWGSRFPSVMLKLYAGEVTPDQAKNIRQELRQIRAELAIFPPEDLCWDFEDRQAQPPWGSDISGEITDLGNYFVTCDGRDLFDVLDAALKDCVEADDKLVVVEEDLRGGDLMLGYGHMPDTVSADGTHLPEPLIKPRGTARSSQSGPPS